MPRKKKRNAGLEIKKKKSSTNPSEGNNAPPPVAPVQAPPPCINELDPPTRDDNTPLQPRDRQDPIIVNIDDDGNLEKATMYDLFEDAEKSYRQCVAYIFLNKYGAVRDEEGSKWGGRDGIISQIRHDLGLAKNQRIRHILEDVRSCLDLGELYTGDRARIDEDAHCGRPVIIEVDSEDAQIIADELESGGSQVTAWNLVNIKRSKRFAPSVTLSAVASCAFRMKPKVVPISWRKQGSIDEGSKWCCARKKNCIQLGIRMGVIDVEVDFPEECVGGIPNYFDRTKLSLIKKDQVASWDEVHRKCQAGTDSVGSLIVTANRKNLSCFPRDKDGRVDLKNGKYSEKEISVLRTKYTEEIRLCLGVAVVTPLNADGTPGEICPKRLPPFVYSGKLLLTINDYQRKVNEEIVRIKGLKNPAAGGWLVPAPGTENKIYFDDPVSKLEGCGKVMEKHLNAGGITCVGDLLSVAEDDEIDKVTKKALKALIQNARSCEHETRPEMIDYTKAKNPYLERYGEEEWESKIKTCGRVRGHVCITDMVDHIFLETKKAFVGTTHQEDYWVYHDALTLMTDKECRKYMDDKGYTKHWILPEQKLLYDDPDLIPYRDRPIGNSPELCCLDNSLNKDVHEQVNRHISFTSTLPKDDPKKFSIATPKAGTKAYLRIFDPENGVAPIPERILQDHEQVFHAVVEIAKENGKVVPDMNIRVRKRREAGIYSGKWGGKRERMLELDDYGSLQGVHIDATHGRQMKLEKSVETYEKKKRDKI